MKVLLKKCLCMALVMCMIVPMMMFDASVVGAEEKKFSTSKGADDKYYVSYDSSKYKIYWVSRKKVTARSQYGSMWSDLDKDDKLGTATIRAYYLEPKSAVDGSSYYAMAGCQISMDPEDVAGDVSGMSQMAHIKIKTPNEDSRVCSPTVEVLNVQASKTASSSTSFTAGTGLKYNTSTKNWEASGQLSFGSTWGSSSSYTYNRTNVNLTQKNKNGDYASWNYDYKSKDEDVTWNAYLFSSSKVAGQVVYRLNSRPTDSNRTKNIPTKLSYDIRFGAGDISTGEVANRLGSSTNRDMSIMTGTITLSY